MPAKSAHELADEHADLAIEILTAAIDRSAADALSAGAMKAVVKASRGALVRSFLSGYSHGAIAAIAAASAPRPVLGGYTWGADSTNAKCPICGRAETHQHPEKS